MDGAVEHFEGCEGLVEGDFVAGFVDADESEVGGLFDLAVGGGVGGAEVGVAGGGEAWGLVFVGDDFIAEL